MSEVDALAKQALSELAFYEKLKKDPNALDCQILHVLQMAGEKAAKAVLYALEPTFRVDAVGKRKLSHVALSKLVPALAKRKALVSAVGLHPDKLAGMLTAYQPLYVAIEQLQPELSQTRENAEYPYLNGRDWIAPCGHRFSILADLRVKDGPAAIRFIRQLARSAPLIANA